MVRINYLGRFGNNLFQYIFGRLLAVKNGLRLDTAWNRPDMITFTENPNGRINSEYACIRLDDQHGQHKTRLDWLEQDLTASLVDLKGYFQHPAFYDDHKELIKSWMLLPEVKTMSDDDIVLHLRLDDYDVTGKVPIIDPSWYADVLAKIEVIDTVHIVVEKPKKQWEIDYVASLSDLLKKYKTVWHTESSAYDDFHFMRSFKTMIISNSSFAWWAAYLSNANKIYTFERWLLNSPLVKLQYARGMTPVVGGYVWEK